MFWHGTGMGEMRQPLSLTISCSFWNKIPQASWYFSLPLPNNTSWEVILPTPLSHLWSLWTQGQMPPLPSTRLGANWASPPVLASMKRQSWCHLPPKVVVETGKFISWQESQWISTRPLGIGWGLGEAYLLWLFSSTWKQHHWLLTLLLALHSYLVGDLVKRN